MKIEFIVNKTMSDRIKFDLLLQTYRIRNIIKIYKKVYEIIILKLFLFDENYQLITVKQTNK